MTGFRSPLIGPLLLLSLAALSCGSSRHLQSVTLLPAAAEAQNFPHGQVQFTATGIFSKPPSPKQLTNKDIGWCVGSESGGCDGNFNPGIALDQNGLAYCLPTFTGTAIVLAGTGIPSSKPDFGGQLKVFGSAKLTCP